MSLERKVIRSLVDSVFNEKEYLFYSVNEALKRTNLSLKNPAADPLPEINTQQLPVTIIKDFKTQIQEKEPDKNLLEVTKIIREVVDNFLLYKINELNNSIKAATDENQNPEYSIEDIDYSLELLTFYLLLKLSKHQSETTTT